MTSLYLGSKIRRWLLQSPPAEWAISQVRELLIGALRQGPIPRHVAFVMDGNRRFARKHQIETVEGHNLGFEAVARILEVCYKAGVEVVTIYAFSIENFKRSKYEVDALMDMAKVKLLQLAQHGDLLDRYGASVRILGQRHLVKPDVLEAIDLAVNLTKHNKRAVLNVCFPYTSRDEITTAIRSTVTAYSEPITSLNPKRPFSETSITRNIRSRKLSTLPEEPSRSPTPTPSPPSAPPTSLDFEKLGTTSVPSAPDSFISTSTSPFSSSTTLNHNYSPDTSYQSPSPPLTAENSISTTPSHPVFPDPELISAATLSSHMFTAGTPPLDLLIRTSGVARLSDFMLWQCHEQTSIVFLKCLWPEFDLWQFLPVLVEWQWWRRKEMVAKGSGRLKVA